MSVWSADNYKCLLSSFPLFFFSYYEYSVSLSKPYEIAVLRTFVAGVGWQFEEDEAGGLGAD